VTGCEVIGTRRPWLTYEARPVLEGDRELALSLFRPFDEKLAP
jgi:hypothetical protein